MGNIQRKAGPALLVLFTTLAIFLVCSFYVPVLAQENELSATIRASLLADPRTQNLSEEELDAMVEALTAAAIEEGITAKDIMWRPEEPEPETFETAVDTCGKLPKFLCMLNDALGFSSGNLAIPILLFLGSAALLIILGLMVKHLRHHNLEQHNDIHTT